MLLFITFEDSRIAELSDLSMAVSVISNSCRTTENKDVAFKQKYRHTQTYTHTWHKKARHSKSIMPTCLQMF